VSDRAVYHLARALVLHRSPRLGERVERYFALTLLSRNLTAAAVVVAGMLVWFGYWGWAVAWVATAGAFLLQYRRFVRTERRAVFGAAAVLLVTQD